MVALTKNSRRWWIALLNMVGVYIIVANRSHIGVAMVCMVNATAVNMVTSLERSDANLTELGPAFDETCPNRFVHEDGNGTVEMVDARSDYRGTFIWMTDQQSLLFSAGFYGNFLIMWASGYLADRFGPKEMTFLSILGVSIAAIASPMIAELSYVGFVAVRVVFGLFENPAMPAMAAMIARWFPASERSTAAGIYTSGNQLASSIGVVIASSLCRTHFLNGWPLIFYLDGLIGFIWLFLLVKFATNTPQESTFLSSTEKDYLYDKNGKHHTTFSERKAIGEKLPLSRMLLSTAVMAVVITQFSFNLTNTLLATYLPTYMRDIMYLNLQENGFYTALPFFVQLLSKYSLSILADVLKSKGILSHTASAKAFQILTNIGTAIACIILALFVNCSRTILLSLVLTLYGFAMGAVIPGCFTATLSIAPSYAGMITSFTLTAGAIGNACAPALVAFVVREGQSSEWAVVYIIVAIVNLSAGLFFAFFGKADVQPWAKKTIPQIQTTQIVPEGLEKPTITLTFSDGTEISRL
uniref:MFS domain-containing protein n=2 Tax=Panagrellus redivivus TaxID=6233 RepID=A0A7E4UV14_PANRE